MKCMDMYEYEWMNKRASELDENEMRSYKITHHRPKHHNTVHITATKMGYYKTYALQRSQALLARLLTWGGLRCFEGGDSWSSGSE